MICATTHSARALTNQLTMMWTSIGSAISITPLPALLRGPAQHLPEYLRDDRYRSAEGVLRAPGNDPIRSYQNRAGQSNAVSFGEIRLEDLVDVQFEVRVVRGVASRRGPLGIPWRGQQDEAATV